VDLMQPSWQVGESNGVLMKFRIKGGIDFVWERGITTAGTRFSEAEIVRRAPHRSQ